MYHSPIRLLIPWPSDILEQWFDECLWKWDQYFKKIWYSIYIILYIWYYIIIMNMCIYIIYIIIYIYIYIISEYDTSISSEMVYKFLRYLHSKLRKHQVLSSNVERNVERNVADFRLNSTENIQISSQSIFRCKGRLSWYGVIGTHLNLRSVHGHPWPG